MSAVCQEHGIEEHDCGGVFVTAGAYRNGVGLCAHCGERPAEVTRGIPTHAAFRSEWCRQCDLEDAISTTKERAAQIPKWEAELAEVQDG